MILFLTSRRGFDASEKNIKLNHYPVWIGQGVLSKNEIETLRKQNFEITEFSYKIDNQDKKKVEEALYTIQEHHPDEIILVERTINLSKI